jgi:hypothetical protein
MMSPNEAEVAPSGEEVLSFSKQELRGMLRAPMRMVDLVLGSRGRFAMNIAQEHRLPSLMLVLTIATAGFALPFGLVLGLDRFWRLAALLMGGLAICVPSLHVFGKYLGARVSWAQTVCIALATTAVTALFTLAFAPIVGFLRLTMTDSASVPPQAVAGLLFAFALTAGMGQLFRLLRDEEALRGLGPSLGVVLIPWLALYVFITVRLASVLGLFA